MDIQDGSVKKKLMSVHLSLAIMEEIAPICWLILDVIVMKVMLESSVMFCV